MGPTRRKLRLNDIRRVGPCSDRTSVLRSLSFPPCLFLSLHLSLSLSLRTFSEEGPCEDRATLQKPRRELSPELNHPGTVILDCSASSTWENKLLLLKPPRPPPPPSLGYFILAAQAKTPTLKLFPVTLPCGMGKFIPQQFLQQMLPSDPPGLSLSPC